MPDYYRYVASPSGNQVELTPVQNKKPGAIVARSVNQEDFCHPVVIPLESIDHL
jgi:hypothetical protein